ncbi:MAG: UDP-N-acetylglucosamine--N-acetylmuramyl-(pentapeptide) pyrophosphoryl-undecaprenol N-acetylglucosamine transferase [Candidatus Pacebacteria bacterium]|nr:UDP-N-acetylglucosamine--N-acetylmuramyl-(pentapeptide) pyrophosphoryl-undecaprenol N-acetylglucosamine transferase [Candidatus Paceibacterota bacterium]
MKIVLVGGGTGGHFYPLIAVAEAIRDIDSSIELYYIGPHPYNQSELDRLNITHTHCPAGKVRRYFSIQNFFDFFRTIAGIFVAWYKLFVLYPDVVFSKGGYTSVPILLMARFYRIPVVVHDSDSKPGRASLFARKFARYIGIAFASAANYFPEGKTALVGIPIRKKVRTPHPNPHEFLGVGKDRPIIFVTGGSLGAMRINNFVLNSLTQLLPLYYVFHQTGPTEEKVVMQTAQALVKDPALLSNYFVQGTMDAETMSALFEAASLIISRAGSTTLFEIALHGTPSIIIPIPEEVSHDQRTNAYSYARSGAATVMEEGNLTPYLLTSEIQSIMGDPVRYETMSRAARTFATPQSAEVIANVLIAIGQEHGS